MDARGNPSLTPHCDPRFAINSLPLPLAAGIRRFSLRLLKIQYFRLSLLRLICIPFILTPNFRDKSREVAVRILNGFCEYEFDQNKMQGVFRCASQCREKS